MAKKSVSYVVHSDDSEIVGWLLVVYLIFAQISDMVIETR
jgi:hypothetical protein